MSRQSSWQARRLLTFVWLVAVPLVRAWLYTHGTEIRSATTYLPVRLRCINWYGAHMESFVAGGLDKRSCREIAQSIKEIGANCVRIPLSVDTLRCTSRAPPRTRWPLCIAALLISAIKVTCNTRRMCCQFICKRSRAASQRAGPCCRRS